MQENQQSDTYSGIQTSASFWPNEQKLRDKLSIPMTLQLCPLEVSDSIKSASFSANPKINQFRCHSCKAFVNYLCKFHPEQEDYYSSYDCSICGCTNRLQRKLSKNSPEITDPMYLCQSVNTTHCMSNNTKQTLAFVIDLSNYGINGQITKKFIDYCCVVIKNMLRLRKSNDKQHISANKNYRIMILAFDKSLYEYYYEDGQINKKINTHLQEIKIGKNEEHFFEEQELIEMILNDISRIRQENEGVYHSSEAFLPALEVVLAKTINSAGRIYFISGICKAPVQFNRGIFDEPENWKDNFQVNKKKCLPETILHLCEKTQMSIHFYIYNSHYINLMPLYVITKMTNGALRHYQYRHNRMFYYQFQHAVCIEPLSMGLQTVLRMRNCSGLKLAGIFGPYRNYKSFNDQIQLMSCPATRKYIFEFVVQGKIQQSSVVIQFSILYTNSKGSRLFKIITYENKLSGNQIEILQSINYKSVNSSYVNAILHNMDSMVRVRNLQIALQDRCKDHFKELRKCNARSEDMLENGEKVEEGDGIFLIKRATPYSVFTYLLLRHYLMNTRHTETLQFDKYVQMKSRMLTTDETSIHTIWPAIYRIDGNKVSIIEMKESQINKVETAIIIDQGDFCHFYIQDADIRKQIIEQMQKTYNTEEAIHGILESQSNRSKYEKVLSVLENIKEQKMTGYMQILFLTSVQGLAMLDEKGSLGYNNFINAIIE